MIEISTAPVDAVGFERYDFIEAAPGILVDPVTGRVSSTRQAEILGPSLTGWG